MDVPVIGAETPFTATYDDDNRMLSYNGFALHYDDNGNLIEREAEGGSVRFTWDARNRLVAIDGPHGQAAFVYDHLGRRIERTVNGTTVRYLYHGPQAIAELQGNALGAVYHTGLMIDEVLARYTTGADRSLLTDALGSVIGLSDENGQLVTRYGYSPFGESGASGEESENPLGYTGREDDRTGLYFYRARYYDPELKRFVSADPIGLAGGINVYGYVEGDPVSFGDPYGLWAASFDAYYGLGGGITVGRNAKTGGWFVSGRVGFGLGGGFGFDPFNEGAADRPRKQNPYARVCPSLSAPATGISAGTFVGVGVGLGLANVGYGGGAGYNFDGTGTSYGGDLSRSSSLNPFVGGFGVSVGGSAGVEVSGWW
jgi:RHS repeat-associated protein